MEEITESGAPSRIEDRKTPVAAAVLVLYFSLVFLFEEWIVNHTAADRTQHKTLRDRRVEDTGG